jgi:hypothetical protein
MTSERLQGLSASFQRFAEIECRGSSLLYERLSLGIADDAKLLGIATYTRQGQPIPNLFFAAVHSLLLNGVEHPLARFYASVSNNPVTDGDPYPDFRDFCLNYREKIIEIISMRLVQTNVVERCSLLLPGFGSIVRRNQNIPLALVEIGASGGLNLYWDRYGYDYCNGGHYGDLNSPVQIPGVFRGSRRPDIPETFPAVSYRIGIDLNPIDVRDLEATAWLRALVWPEHRSRLERMNRAIEMTQAVPPTVLKGDALDLLPEVLAEAPGDSALCIFHTHTVNQFPIEARERLNSILMEYAHKRDFYQLSSEHRDINQAAPTLKLITYQSGDRTSTTLAMTDAHGRWLEWLV